ncbi:hypothetical protein J1605_014131 [Eschrichtius robustus]|uniref:Uncharacterized protein n=1 Tax=Eschrichtius robustus TaxID=9764 RepID=A0AB34GHK6_ESCRO|nr:hypothetical protein J1605_014131 [Eschrichtius robustus]
MCNWPKSLLYLFFRILPKRGQEKADIHLSISNKYPCASLQEELISWHCNQRRIGLSNRNSRISNPDVVSEPKSSAPRAEQRWEPREWKILQPARLRHTSGNSGHSGEETSPPLDQHQHSALGSSSGLLDELLSATDIQEKVQPFLNADAREEEPPGIPEAALSKEEFQALLDMLPSSPGPQT